MQIYNLENCEENVVMKPGYAFVPYQKMGKVYSPEMALVSGTIFPELNITLEEYERGIYNGR